MSRRVVGRGLNGESLSGMVTLVPIGSKSAYPPHTHSPTPTPKLPAAAAAVSNVFLDESMGS